ncbi:LuxR C-terminal-related transcriptional regulator [Ktedonosporobacter rubrisoli]|uniref:LuxR C-terminal-related transcriptional regulator n=1 Tax=Ktedonosporobacter rubrisoli TaxID=2509675 RepID=UPI0013EE3FC6|nr:LuxR C-terminal-related transcriptional regulator [Ktedonosporobacter rubrisoli]
MLDLATNRLPWHPTSFIGRQQEINQLCALLQRQEVRLLTLTGPAGVGKTRLSIEVGTRLIEKFADGVFFVPLASVTDPQQVVMAILQTLSIDEVGTVSPLASLQTALRDKELLLILDNFEQVLEAGTVLAALLAACPRLKMLVTSRIVLRLLAEWEVMLSPLSIPPTDPPLDPDQLCHYEAVALFVARAQAVKVDFALSSATAGVIATICTRLDGLPLAIELAAARSKYFSPQQLLAQLKDALAILSQGASDLPERQRTMRAAIAWSYQLLTEPERQIFRRLSVFADSYDEEAAATVCNAASPIPISVLEGMLSLVDKSLLRSLQHAEHAPRFQMLTLLREFGLACLTSAEEVEPTREAHATLYLKLAEQAPVEREQKQWHDRLEQEHSHLRAALAWWLEGTSRAKQEATELALRLCLALSEFWQRRGHQREARDFFERALQQREGVSKELQARALYQLFLLETTQDDYQAAEAHLAESFALSEELGSGRDCVVCLTGFVRLALIQCQHEVVKTRVAELRRRCQVVADDASLGLALTFFARSCWLQGDYAQARELLEESKRCYQRAQSPYVLLPQTHLARLLFLANQDLAQAQALAEQCLKGWQALGEKEQSASTLNLLGQIALFQGGLALAQSLFEQSLAIVEETLDRSMRAEMLLGLARLCLQRHEPERACELFQEIVTLLREIGSRQILPAALEGWGFALARTCRPGQAAQLWGAALLRRESAGIKRQPIEVPFYESQVREVRSQLGESRWNAAIAQGKDMTLEALVAHVKAAEPAALPHREVGEPSKTQEPENNSPLPAGLTERESEVLRLLAQGLSNAQIAERLVISPRTVTTHLSSIYGKIGVSSRSAATRYAVDHNVI